MVRILVLPLIALLVALCASAAAADEVVVLDNGQVLRGWIIRESEDALQLRLTGLVRRAEVQIPKHRIVKRFSSVEEDDASQAPDAPRTVDWAGSSHAVETEMPALTDRTSPWGAELPATEPKAREEGFFQRLARRSIQSVPTSTAGRTAVGILLFIALLVLVTLGARIAEIESLDLAKTTVLATLLGSILFVDVWFHEEILRADRATWILPLQGLLWLTSALLMLRCGAARVVLLFSFVLFSITIMVFMFGVILMSF